MQWKPDSKVLIQGITEPLGAYYATRMKDYGTNIVAGVSVGQKGQQANEIPIFDLVEEAIAEVGAIDISLIFIPPYQVLDAALEAIAAGIEQIIIVTRGVPPLDMVRLLRKAQATNTLIIGSGSHGLIIPNQLWLGICEAKFYLPGHIGLISRTDNLSDEVALSLTQAGLGQSIAVSLGTDGIIGTNFEQWLKILQQDEKTEAIVLLGQMDGSIEMAATEYIASTINKPIIAYISGIHAPVERSFGDAATMIAAELSVPATSTDKQAIAALKQAKVNLAKRPSEIPKLVQKALR